MTDDLDPTRLLASAALDNEATADERAQVAASESLTAEMLAYAGLRDEIAAVEVPAPARESAIAAALAVFDAIHAGTDVSSTGALAASAFAPPDLGASPSPPASSPSTNVVSLHARRQRQYRWVGGIAAAAVVAVVGIAVINGPKNSDDDKSASTDAAPRIETLESTAKATDEAEQSDAAELPPLVAAAPATTASAEGGASGGLPATTAAAAETTEAGVESAADMFDPWAGVPAFNSVDDAVAYALAPGSPLALPASSPAGTEASTETTEAAEDGSATTGPATTVPPAGSVLASSAYAACDTGGLAFLPIYFMDKRVLVVRDDLFRQFQIIDAETCALTATVALP